MAKQRKFSPDEMPAPGSVYVAPLADGRYGVVRVIRHQGQPNGNTLVLVVASDWIGATAERPDDTDILRTLKLRHHSWRGGPQVLWVFEPPPDDFLPVGHIDLTDEDLDLESNSYANWRNHTIQILLQWRWDHDRDALLTEEAAKKAREAEERRIEAERRAEMLRTLTLDVVADRRWFEHYDDDDHPEIAAFRTQLETLIQGLRDEEKLTKARVRRHLRLAVKAFNTLDAGDYDIDTVYREEIAEALEMIMCAARQPDLADEIDNWREW